jgi:hypothetical protein
MRLAHVARWLGGITLALLVVGALGAADKDKLSKEDRDKAEKAVKDLLESKNANGRLTAVTDEAVVKTLPDRAAFSVIFPSYPVARIAPEPFKMQNVFLVGKDGKPEQLNDTKQLEKFVKDNVTAKDESSMKSAVETWLRLSQEFHQDGFYKFAFDKDSLKITTDEGKTKIVARVNVAQGGKGDLTAVLTFDDKGKLASATEENTIKPGVRPICQATKLLDADPLVRRIAEQDILVMGRSCKDYLDEQRAKATPELQKAIDRLWKRIVDEGW